MDGSPWAIDELVLNDTESKFSFNIVGQQCVEAITPKTGTTPSTCCAMTLDKLEIVISNECRGAIKEITVDGIKVSPVYENNTYISAPDVLPSPYPEAQPWYLVFKVTRLPGASTVEVTLRGDGECAVPSTFLLNSNLWYAFFNGNSYRNNCCSTYLVAPEDIFI